MRKKSISLLTILLSMLVSCARTPKPVIFDTDWWTDVDDACALRLLIQEDRKGSVDLLGVCLSAVCETSVPSLSSFLDYEGAGSMRIGADKLATDYPGKSTWHQTILDNHSERAVLSIDEVQDCVEFYRDLLSKSRKKVDIIAVGFPNAISRLLESDPELVRKKVGHLWIMAGKFPEGEEHNFALTERSRVAGKNLCSNWPTHATFLGYEVGMQVRVGGSVPEDDLLHKVLVAHGSAKGRYAWDPMLSWMACLGSPGQAGFETVAGTVSLDPVTGKNGFTPKADGPHRYVIMAHEPDWYASAIEEILLKKQQ